MRRPRSALLITAIVSAVLLSACSDDSDQFGAVATSPSPVGSSPAQQAGSPAATSAAGPDLRSADRLQNLTASLAPRTRAFPATAGERFLAAGSDLGVVEDLGCFATVDQFGGPNIATPIDCSQPHVAEKYGSVAMDDSWPADYSAYGPDGAARERWLAWADAQCGALLSEAVGGDPIARSLGVTAPIIPNFEGGFGFVVPRAEWDAGTRVTHCYVTVDGDAPPAGRWVPRLLSGDKPNETSYCDAGGGNGTLVEVRCNQPHWREWAFSTDALSALGQQFVDSVDPNSPTDAQWQVIDQFCTRSFVGLIGSQRGDLRMLGSIGGPSWGEGGQYRVWCTISPADPALQVAGSSIGVGDGQLVFSPYPG